MRSVSPPAGGSAPGRGAAAPHRRTPRAARRAAARRAAALTAALTAALLAAACVPGTDGSAAPGAGGSGAAASEVPDPAKAGKATLTVWDQEIRGGQNAELERLNREFEEKYPNVRIKRVARSFSDLKTTLKLAISGNKPPDVIQANQGYPDMVAFVKAGLLRPLDDYAGIYAWNTRYPATLLNLNRVSADARNFGTGRLYGISQTGEYIGVYYNKDVLDDAGIEPPETWKDLTDALPELKDEGELPVQFGNLDKYPAIHTFGVLQNQAGGADETRESVFGRGEGFDNDPTREAARTLADWKERGYVPEGANGTGYDDAAKKFADGEGAFLITGTWQLADLKKSMGGKLGFMPPPPADAGAPPVTTGGQGLAWSVTSRARHPQVAAAYLDFITSAHAADVMTEEGVLPALPGKAARRLPEGSVDAQMVDGWRKLNDSDGLVPYLDYTTPTFYDSLSADLQGVIDGKLTPEELSTRMDRSYTSFQDKQAGRKPKP
ncbi:carbohydrate ABC transporter substrate-binding protein, CUT1 family (TC 3.A.1.1.-) [Streptomyces sp. WMMB 714]|uniref:ABC transporter substrate-binding protein n=1 Tax=Streptomyces sp. WMMB 714 TaxID=1286822 RepID=UPI000823E0BE|nr:extracellular solute-binding protein [Streptomyces sp. WMMB 714]SCK53425.1 carbohydrate ABC transporter substrate-binding protein, CUT1 family (TC 3.A.1.1.-) [Streptomyces sp. WMMB 714]